MLSYLVHVALERHYVIACFFRVPRHNQSAPGVIDATTCESDIECYEATNQQHCQSPCHDWQERYPLLVVRKHIQCRLSDNVIAHQLLLHVWQDPPRNEVCFHFRKKTLSYTAL